jgi:hypothetical protein
MRRVERHAAMRYAAPPTFLANLRGREGIAARALEFTLLTREWRLAGFNVKLE